MRAHHRLPQLGWPDGFDRRRRDRTARRRPKGLVDSLERLLSDAVLREQLGAKAQARSGEFSWQHSAEAMGTVLESVRAGRIVSGVV